MQLIKLGNSIRTDQRPSRRGALLPCCAVACWFFSASAAAQEGAPPGPAVQPQPPTQPTEAEPPPQGAYPPYAQQPEQQPAPPQQQQQPYPPQQQPSTEPAQPSPNYAAAPPPTPAASSPSLRSKLVRPDFSVRIDPLNWLLLGRLSFELEVEVLEWLTVELVPIFVTTEEPVLFADGLHQESNGLGALAGASLGVGFWLDGNSFNGTVLRAGLTNYGYEYFGVSPVDEGSVQKGDKLFPITHTERRLSFMVGSGRTWGAFTIAGGIGLEYEMNQQTSCIIRDSGIYTGSRSEQTCEDRLGADYDDSRQLVSTRPDANEGADINGALHPFDFIGRISLGVVLDE